MLGKRSTVYRMYEMIPGAITWTILAGSVLISFVKPLWAIYFIIVYDVYWLVRLSYFVVYLLVSWQKFQSASRIDWHERLIREYAGKWEPYIHLVFIPTYQEPIALLKDTIAGIAATKYENSRLWVIVGFEARDPDHHKKKTALESEFSGVFYHFTTTVHKLAPDELAGKSANASHMGKEVKKLIDAEALPYERFIVSNLDSDTVVHPQYFSYLTYTFASHPNPYRSSFQPIAVYDNNLWSAPTFTRVVANSTTFWLMTELSRPEQMFTFSSHSMSFKALVDVGFWDKTIVTEDSRIFIQCFLKYQGDYSIQPLFIPVSMDTVTGATLSMTIRNQYRQILRWAYSVEHFPYMLHHFRREKGIPARLRFHYLFKLGEGLISWATAPFIILILGRLPLYVAGSLEHTEAVVYNAPFILEWLMRFALIGIFVSALFSTLLVPREKLKKRGILSASMLVLQWVFLPVTMIVFGAIPAIHAQTRLMLGKYMGFYNTIKLRS